MYTKANDSPDDRKRKAVSCDMEKLMVSVEEKGYFSLSAFGETWFRFPVKIAADADGKKDADECFLPMKAYFREENGDSVTHVWRTVSSLWKSKEYRLEVGEGFARFYVRLVGDGMIDRLRFFENSADYETAGYMLPLANHADEKGNLRMITEPGTLELGYFAPPSYVYPFYMEDVSGWLGVGLAAKEGQYGFHQFLYENQAGKCGFTLPLYGKTAVHGVWESQSLVFLTGRDAYDVVKAYADYHYSSGLCRKPDRDSIPDWWKKPLFCGWGEQGGMAERNGGSVYAYANQAAYTEMSEKLDALDLHPGAIIIDDKWQKAYGESLPDPEKWPDMRAFTDQEHKKGRKVLLWFRSWYPEGLTQAECIEYLCTACGADPSSEVYRERIRKTMRTLLSDEPGCYHADGFKIDFANCMPLGTYVMTHEEGLAGVELLKRYMKLLYDSAKAIRPDALINCSAAHPYFAEVMDEARLHDYRGDMRNCVSVMTHRAKLMKAALPGILIDTDAGGTGSRRDFRRFIAAQPSLGVPDLYFLSPNGAVPFDDEDVALIRETWKRYEDRISSGQD